MPTSVYDTVMGWRLNQEYKHDLSPGHAADQINQMNHEEFLREISEAIERRLDPENK